MCNRAKVGLVAILLGAFAITYLIIAPMPGVGKDPFWFTFLFIFFLACSAIAKAYMVLGIKVRLANLASVALWFVLLGAPLIIESQGPPIQFPLGFHLSFGILLLLWPIIDFIDLVSE